jgi:hypothetical protein
MEFCLCVGVANSGDDDAQSELAKCVLAGAVNCFAMEASLGSQFNAMVIPFASFLREKTYN